MPSLKGGGRAWTKISIPPLKPYLNNGEKPCTSFLPMFCWNLSFGLGRHENAKSNNLPVSS